MPAAHERANPQHPEGRGAGHTSAPAELAQPGRRPERGSREAAWGWFSNGAPSPPPWKGWTRVVR